MAAASGRERAVHPPDVVVRQRISGTTSRSLPQRQVAGRMRPGCDGLPVGVDEAQDLSVLERYVDVVGGDRLVEVLGDAAAGVPPGDDLCVRGAGGDRWRRVACGSALPPTGRRACEFRPARLLGVGACPCGSPCAWPTKPLSARVGCRPCTRSRLASGNGLRLRSPRPAVARRRESSTSSRGGQAERPGRRGSPGRRGAFELLAVAGACRAWSLVIAAGSSASSGSASSAMSRRALAWQARLVNAYRSRQSSGVRSATSTARSSSSRPAPSRDGSCVAKRAPCVLSSSALSAERPLPALKARSM